MEVTLIILAGICIGLSAAIYILVQEAPSLKELSQGYERMQEKAEAQAALIERLQQANQRLQNELARSVHWTAK